MIKKIVTHGGAAHLDDVLAVALALGLVGEKEAKAPLIPVYRRDPTPGELEDPQVLVLDVGGRHDPQLNNWDHHGRAFGVEDAECALTLYASWALWDQVRGVFPPWVRHLAVMDHCGPFKWATWAGVSGNKSEHRSPLDGLVLRMFEEEEEILPRQFMHELLWELGWELLSQLRSWSRDYERLLKKTRVIDGFLVVDEKLSGSKASIMSAVRANNWPQIYGQISRDDRGPGWALYRYDDFVGLDFSRLAKKPGVIFAHTGGFIAKTEEMDLAGAVRLALKSTCPECKQDCPHEGCPWKHKRAEVVDMWEGVRVMHGEVVER